MRGSPASHPRPDRGPPASSSATGGNRRRAGGHGHAPPFSAADLAAVLATCHRPRPRGRGRESDAGAAERGRLDAVIAGLLFMAGMRRSEVAALCWADVWADALVDAERRIEARIAERVPPGLQRDLEHLLEETVDAVEDTYGPVKSAGLDYLQIVELGNEGEGTGVIRLKDAAKGLALLSDEVKSRVVAIMCVCREPEACHRSVVARKMSEQMPGLRIEHLRALSQA